MVVATTPAERFERHHAAIYRYLLRMIGSRETAEELTQEVFMRVLKGLEHYQERDRRRPGCFASREISGATMPVNGIVNRSQLRSWISTLLSRLNRNFGSALRGPGRIER